MILFSLPLRERVRERVMDLLNNAKSLRSNQTDAEIKLWYHLRAHRFLGLKFKRQKPVGDYIVDFVCLEQHLVIELDGEDHGVGLVRNDCCIVKVGRNVKCAPGAALAIGVVTDSMHYGRCIDRDRGVFGSACCCHWHFEVGGSSRNVACVA